MIFFSNLMELSGLSGTASQDSAGSPQTKTMKDYEYVSTQNIVCFPPVTNKEIIIIISSWLCPFYT